MSAEQTAARIGYQDYSDIGNQTDDRLDFSMGVTTLSCYDGDPLSGSGTDKDLCYCRIVGYPLSEVAMEALPLSH